MKNAAKSVKLKGVEVAALDVPQYETVDELINGEQKLDEALILSLINRQIVTDACNTERAKHREGTPGKKKRNELAFNLLPTVEFDDGETWQDKLIACGGDATKLDALINSDEVQAAVDAKIGPAAA